MRIEIRYSTGALAPTAYIDGETKKGKLIVGVPIEYKKRKVKSTISYFLRHNMSNDVNVYSVNQNTRLAMSFQYIKKNVIVKVTDGKKIAAIVFLDNSSREYTIVCKGKKYKK